MENKQLRVFQQGHITITVFRREIVDILAKWLRMSTSFHTNSGIPLNLYPLWKMTFCRLHRKYSLKKEKKKNPNTGNKARSSTKVLRL